MSILQVHDTPLGKQQDLVRIRLYLNKDLDKTNNFDKSQDVYVDIEYDEREISLADLEIDLKSKFRRKSKEISARIKDKSYDIEVFSYHENIHIEDDDDLLTEIEAIFPDHSDSDETPENLNIDKMVAFRIVFTKSYTDANEKKDDIPTIKSICTEHKITSQVIQEPGIDKEEKDQDTKQDITGIPLNLSDPITKKIMANPIMIVSSLQVYDSITIKKWIESKRYYDPITGIPMCLGGWPLLLQRRADIQLEIKKFIQKNPLYKSNVLIEDDEKSIEWENIFKTIDIQIQNKCKEIIHDQTEMRVKAKQLYKPIQLKDDGDNDDELGIEYEDSIMLDPNIPVVCIMGPSRNGKSTIINGLLGVKDACKTSTKANVALTKGAWITKYSTKPHKDEMNIYQQEGVNDTEEKKEEKTDEFSEFYLLDMEGLSHNVTAFTKRLFYACYATSDLIIWNDKNVGSDEFKRLMNELKQEMGNIANSDKKPAFLYLERDAGDYNYDHFDTLDAYINKDISFEWFREMNIFSSLSGYELDRPIKDKSNKKGGLNFLSKTENKQLLQPLIETILCLCKSSSRFASNMIILKQQIKHINQSTGLSMTEKMIIDNEILRLFLISAKGDKLRKRDIIYVACEFDWDYEIIEKRFNEEIKKVIQILEAINEIDKEFVALLQENKSEICEGIKNKVLLEWNLWNFAMQIGVSVLVGALGPFGILVVGIMSLTGRLGVAIGVYLATSVSNSEIATTSVYAYVPAMEWKKERDTSKFATKNYMKYALGKTDQEKI